MKRGSRLPKFGSTFGWLVGSALLVPLLLHSIAAVADEASPRKATLHWVNGDSLPGELQGANGQHLLWNTKVFLEPVAIDYRVLQYVEFVSPGSVELPKEDFRVDLATGDVLFGKILDLTVDEVVLSGQRHGSVRIQRKFIRALEIHPARVDIMIP